jgi:hypothetical protein
MIRGVRHAQAQHLPQGTDHGLLAGGGAVSPSHTALQGLVGFALLVRKQVRASQVRCCEKNGQRRK